ncbi:zinc finger protein 19-like [Protopterus annectens]|uniref:zinc finger protein 19-like n=1 Tax=Protopterus annectens TaxID=7888 RepID=UPI001CFB0301|nr:zinc finger protein 19-like [Protopterus annectens]
MLEVPEAFEDVAVAFSKEEWMVLSQEEKRLHREVMVQNYETMLSVGYNIPLEELLLLVMFERDDGVPFNDVSMEQTEQQDKHPAITPAVTKTVNSKGRCVKYLTCGKCYLNHRRDMLYQHPQCQKTFHVLHSVFVKRMTHEEKECNNTEQLKNTSELNIDHCPGSFFNEQCIIIGEQNFKVNKQNQHADSVQNFSDQSRIMLHQTTFMGNKQISCGEHVQNFSQQDNTRHCVHIHSEGHRNNCHECGKNYTSDSGFVTQQQSNKEEKPFICPECGMNLKSDSELLIHQQTHTGCKRFICCECGTSFSRYTAFTAHQQMQTSCRVYICNECDKSFASESELGLHEQIHAERQFCCEECGKTFVQQKNFRAHQQIHIG